ncbi:MAG: chorismate synthase [Spirochaetaceae bacterium]|jgi:chorismate synthase|nr:chorismate synthase [Spirochaetaceae bacterium]
MAGNSFGRLFTVVTFGESHGKACGCVIDGCPSGLVLEPELIARDLRRRRPGAAAIAATSRSEADEPEILSGVFEGKTLGTPIAIMVRNCDQHTHDYDALRDIYRPGHADWTWEKKFGLRDHRGGGRSSGRETLARVAAGAVAKILLASSGITIRAWVSALAGINAPAPRDADFDAEAIERNPVRVPHHACAVRIQERLQILKNEGDSAGGTVFCQITGLFPGLGEPVFDKLDALLAGAMLSIGAAKAVSFGAGFAAAEQYGSTHNDSLAPCAGPAGVHYTSNNAGGILGGISTGEALELQVTFKPTPSIRKQQETVDTSGVVRTLSIQGRHDVSLVPRAVPVVEAMAALVLADMLLLSRGNKL